MQLIIKTPFVTSYKMVKNQKSLEKKETKNKQNAILLCSHSNASMYILYMNGGLLKKKL